MIKVHLHRWVCVGVCGGVWGCVGVCGWGYVGGGKEGEERVQGTCGKGA